MWLCLTSYYYSYLLSGFLDCSLLRAAQMIAIIIIPTQPAYLSVVCGGSGWLTGRLSIPRFLYYYDVLPVCNMCLFY